MFAFCANPSNRPSGVVDVWLKRNKRENFHLNNNTNLPNLTILTAKVEEKIRQKIKNQKKKTEARINNRKSLTHTGIKWNNRKQLAMKCFFDMVYHNQR